MMNRPRYVAITPVTLSTIHQRVLQCDSSAHDEVAAYFLDRLPRILLRRHQGFDSVTVEEAVEDAVIYYIHHPRTYNPSKSSLATFIERAALRNVLDHLRRDKRQRGKEEARRQAVTAVMTQKEMSDGERDPPWTVIAGQDADVTHRQWMVLQQGIELAPMRGRPPKDHRLVFNGILWVLRRNARWKDLPKLYPPYQTCHRYYRRWQTTGLLRKLLHRLSNVLRNET